MYKQKRIAVVVPAFNEEARIGKMLTSVPEYVDEIIVIDDCSKDHTVEVVKEIQSHCAKVHLTSHRENQGVGGAIATGYIWARNRNADIAVVMAGDGQMHPDDLPNLLDPVIKGEADYTKGNRLAHKDAFKMIPKDRYWGIVILSRLTSLITGYWHVNDSQSGYTAANQAVLRSINWDQMYKRYGQPNDLLVRLSIHNFKVKDVVIRPVYHPNGHSGIKLRSVVFSISWLLIKLTIMRVSNMIKR